MRELIADLAMVIGFVVIMGVVGASDYETLVTVPVKPISWYIGNVMLGFILMVGGYKLQNRM